MDVAAVGDVAVLGLEPVSGVLGWQATIQIVVTVASKARQSVEKNLLVMVAMNYDHVDKVAVIVSVLLHSFTLKAEPIKF